jgi:hypothetical protein
MARKNESKELVIFDGKNIRRHWNDKEEKWYFSVVDIVSVLTQQDNNLIARKYWNKLAERLRNEGSEVVTKCHRLKLRAGDGKMRLMDVADTETIFRLTQSVPSPKAEPIKLWLAKVGYERVQDISDPEKSINRGREYWRKMGRSEEWIQRRMMGQETRNKLTFFVIARRYSDVAIHEYYSNFI